jgi:hypothetical protein
MSKVPFRMELRMKRPAGRPSDGAEAKKQQKAQTWPPEHFNSQQPAYLELDANNELAKLKADVKAFKRDIEITSEVLNKQISDVHQHLSKKIACMDRIHWLIQEGALEFAAMAFVDSFIEATYKLAGVDSLNNEEKVKWLKSDIATNFLDHHSSFPLKVHGSEFNVNSGWLHDLRKFRAASTYFSTNSYYHASPLQVAFALDKKLPILTNVQGHLEYLFSECFGMSYGDMVELFKENKHSPNHLEKFYVYIS